MAARVWSIQSCVVGNTSNQVVGGSNPSGRTLLQENSAAATAVISIEQFEPPTDNKTGSTTWPQAKLTARRAAPKGRAAQRRVIRPGALENQELRGLLVFSPCSE